MKNKDVENVVKIHNIPNAKEPIKEEPKMITQMQNVAQESDKLEKTQKKEFKETPFNHARMGLASKLAQQYIHYFQPHLSSSDYMEAMKREVKNHYALLVSLEKELK